MEGAGQELQAVAGQNELHTKGAGAGMSHPLSCTSIDFNGGTQRQVQKMLLRRNSRPPPKRKDPLENVDWNRLGPSDFNCLKLLGQGTFGSVIKVCMRDDPRVNLAMKIIVQKQYKVQNIVSRYYAEEHVLRALKHPFIVLLYASYSTPLHWLLVMEYCPGGDLHDWLVQEGTPGLLPIQVLKAGTEILLALEYLHGKGIVFRDLKCENVILSAQKTCRLTDFGLAKEDIGATDTDGLTSFCGSYGYCAPEVLALKDKNRRGGEIKSPSRNKADELVRGLTNGKDNSKESKKYGTAVDIYSLGVVLYMLATGGHITKKTETNKKRSPNRNDKAAGTRVVNTPRDGEAGADGGKQDKNLARAGRAAGVDLKRDPSGNLVVDTAVNSTAARNFAKKSLPTSIQQRPRNSREKGKEDGATAALFQQHAPPGTKNPTLTDRPAVLVDEGADPRRLDFRPGDRVTDVLGIKEAGGGTADRTSTSRARVKMSVANERDPRALRTGRQEQRVAPFVETTENRSRSSSKATEGSSLAGRRAVHRNAANNPNAVKKKDHQHHEVSLGTVAAVLFPFSKNFNFLHPSESRGVLDLSQIETKEQTELRFPPNSPEDLHLELAYMMVKDNPTMQLLDELQRLETLKRQQYAAKKALNNTNPTPVPRPLATDNTLRTTGGGEVGDGAKEKQQSGKMKKIVAAGEKEMTGTRPDRNSTRDDAARPHRQDLRHRQVGPPPPAGHHTKNHVQERHEGTSQQSVHYNGGSNRTRWQGPSKEQLRSVKDTYERFKQHPHLLELVYTMTNRDPHLRGSCSTVRSSKYFMNVDFMLALVNSGRYFRDMQRRREKVENPFRHRSGSGTSSQYPSKSELCAAGGQNVEPVAAAATTAISGQRSSKSRGDRNYYLAGASRTSGQVDARLRPQCEREETTEGTTRPLPVVHPRENTKPVRPRDAGVVATSSMSGRVLAGGASSQEQDEPLQTRAGPTAAPVMPPLRDLSRKTRGQHQEWGQRPPPLRDEEHRQMPVVLSNEALSRHEKKFPAQHFHQANNGQQQFFGHETRGSSPESSRVAGVDVAAMAPPLHLGRGGGLTQAVARGRSEDSGRGETTYSALPLRGTSTSATSSSTAMVMHSQNSSTDRSSSSARKERVRRTVPDTTAQQEDLDRHDRSISEVVDPRSSYAKGRFTTSTRATMSSPLDDSFCEVGRIVKPGRSTNKSTSRSSIPSARETRQEMLNPTGDVDDRDEQEDCSFLRQIMAHPRTTQLDGQEDFAVLGARNGSLSSAT
ncbi:unnamed protein product [Amoebophrya sp. A120]|nr:unnamed protein product [Amoebophrya sp. A120]|eukprot:GSA120T00012739001.1